MYIMDFDVPAFAFIDVIVLIFKHIVLFNTSKFLRINSEIYGDMIS